MCIQQHSTAERVSSGGLFPTELTVAVRKKPSLASFLGEEIFLVREPTYS
jgi:hypothetical protein